MEKRAPSSMAMIAAVASTVIACPLLAYYYKDIVSYCGGASTTKSDPTILDKAEQAANKTAKFIILYASTTGTSKIFAHRVLQALMKAGVPSDKVLVKDCKEYDCDILSKEDNVIFLCSTWSEGRPPESSKIFFEWLEDARYDFRVDKNIFEKLKFVSFGLGGAVYGSNFCRPVHTFSECMTTLGKTIT